MKFPFFRDAMIVLLGVATFKLSYVFLQMIDLPDNSAKIIATISAFMFVLLLVRLTQDAPSRFS